jgi:pyruvate,water dikinase
MVYYNRLKKKVQGSKITEKYPNFLNDILMQDGEVISVEIVRAFQNLLEEIYLSEKLSTLFQENSAAHIFDCLKTDFTDFYKSVNHYIQAYGSRASSSELKMETITYKEDPVSFIHALKINVFNYVPNASNSKPTPYKTILKEIYPNQFIRRIKLARLIKKTVVKTKARENYRFKRTETFAVVRNLVLACGNQLYIDNKIDARRDVLYLNFEDLINAAKTKNYRALIRIAKERYAAYSSENEMIRYVENKDILHPIHLSNQTIKEGTLSGIGCCSGKAEGQIKIIRTIADLDQDFNGCIVVAKYFEPGWINVFSQASGIVSERGNLLSHTAIISRELGIPSIVGVKGIIQAVQQLESISINGAKGIVYL